MHLDYLLKSKSDAQNFRQYFIAMVENQFTSRIKIDRTNYGSEFAMNHYFFNKENIHQLSCVATPQPNSLVEIKPQHI